MKRLLWLADTVDSQVYEVTFVLSFLTLCQCPWNGGGAFRVHCWYWWCIQGPLTLLLRPRRRAEALCRLCRVFWTMSFHCSSEISRAHDGTPRDGNATAAIVLFTSSTWSAGRQEVMSGHRKDFRRVNKDWCCWGGGAEDWIREYGSPQRTCRTCVHGDGGSAPLGCRPLRVLLFVTVWGRSFREVEPHHLQETWVRLRMKAELHDQLRVINLCSGEKQWELTSILCCTCCSCSVWEGPSSPPSSPGCSGSWFRGW